MTETTNPLICALDTTDVDHARELARQLHGQVGAIKLGLEAMTSAFAVQMAPFKVTVNCVVPGLIRKPHHTEQFLSNAEWDALAAKIPMRFVAPSLRAMTLNLVRQVRKYTKSVIVLMRLPLPSHIFLVLMERCGG